MSARAASVIGPLMALARIQVTTAQAECADVGMRRVPVLGAADPFCLYDEPCRTGSTVACPSNRDANIMGVVALRNGSCCSGLPGNPAVVGCVSLDLILTEAGFQCLSAPSIRDPQLPTPSNVTTFEPASSPPSSSAPGSPTPSLTNDPRQVATLAPSPTVAPNSTQASSPISTITTPTPSLPNNTHESSSGNGSSSASSEISSVNDVGGGHTPQPAYLPSPAPPPPSQSPWVDLSTLTPIVDDSPAPVPLSSNSHPASTKFNDVRNASSNNARIIDNNIGIFLIVGIVALIAIVFGAFILRRGNGGRVRKPQHTASVDDEGESLEPGYHHADLFSPIQVLSSASYHESTTPGHDREARQSYFL